MKAKEVIAKLKEDYVADNFHFAFVCSQYLAGNDKKRLRVEIMEELTGEKLPATKCGLHTVSDAVKASIEQLTLFEI